MDTDKVSATMGNYMLQGWAMLNDGCPDCNTPLMRNREATSQICVNCQLNPPVDPEETTATPTTPPATAQPTAPLPPPPAVAPMSTPAPTSALPSLPSTPAPGPLRPPSPQNHRSSTLDPMLEARRALRPVGARNIGGSAPQPPSTPPPRSATPLPMPPTTPPPPAGAKLTSGPLGLKPANIPRPPGPPPAAPLTPPPSLPLAPPPPAGTLIPTLVPRDMKRSPQSSVILSGPILPPSTPPPPPPSAITSGPLPSPPTGPVPPVAAESTATEVSEPVTAAAQEQETDANAAITTTDATPITAEEPGEEQENHGEEIESEVTVEAFEVDEPDADTQSLLEVEQPTEVVQEQAQEQAQEPTQVQEEQTPVQPQEQEEKQEEMQEEPAQEQPHEQAQEAEDEEDDNDDGDKTGVESDDDFEDAEEEVFKPSEDEVKERESKREQSERASRLIGQKMLQGWAMLQDPCPNPSCHGVPLLRNREKKEYCVVCENYFQREQDLEHGKYTVVNPEPVSAPLPPLPPAPTTLPPPPQTPSPALPPQHQAVASVTSPSIRAASPLTSPSMGRTQRDLAGRVSGSIILPPAAPMPASLASASQQILGKHLSEDFDKMTSEDEEARKHIQIIRKGGEFSNRSLPPVPSGPLPPAGSRPTSTYSTSSEYHPSESERPDLKLIRPPRYNNPREHHANGPSHHQQPQHASSNGSGPEHNGPAPPPPAPLSPEVQALVAATHKTMATILVKLEAYRLALEVSESPKECQALTAQIKGLMECLKACRETL
ncbi:hypothetical protein BGW39_010377 [Mortierella sp. 14UC]|nr:hypothetical protein BGW39_010377 [Mortierella sp. 14UC]